LGCNPSVVRERFRVIGEVVRDPRMLRLMLSFFAFNMAEYGTWVAILVYAYDRGGAAVAGVVAVVVLFPAGIVAPFGAFAGDRFRRDRVLLVSFLGQALGLALVAVSLLIDAPFAVPLLFAALGSVGFTFTRPTLSALLPEIADGPEELTAANAASSFVENAGIVLGPFVAGILLARGGPSVVYALFAAVALVSALLVARLHVPGEDVDAKEQLHARDVLREAAGGFTFLFHNLHAGLVVLVLAGGSVVMGAIDVLVVAVAITLLGKGQGWAGFLSAAFGVGGLIGAALAIGLIGRRRLVPSLGGATFTFGGAVVAVGAAPAVVTAPALFAVGGAGGSMAWVAGSTLLQRMAPAEMLTRVFGILEGVGMFAVAVGSVGASILIESLGVRVAVVAVGALAPLVMLVVWMPLASIDREAKAPDAEALAFIRRMHIFAPLPAPALETIMANLQRISLDAGHVLIREGETGDRFFMIVGGKAEVTREGAHLSYREAGEHVGEVALLRDEPRNATVTALTPMAILALDREPFIEAVTGHPQSHERAKAIVQDRLAPPDPPVS